MKYITEIKATDRIKNLREYYINNSPMSTNRDLVPWHCHRSLLLYVQGWDKVKYTTDTARIRRSFAEKYVLENIKPIIVPGELIAGQPDLRTFSPEEQALFQDILDKEKYIPLKRGRRDHMALDYQLLLDKGIDGIIDILDSKISEINLNDGTQVEKYEYYYCCKVELEGVKTLCLNYADEALRLANNSSGKEREDYLSLYEVLKQVPINPARSFREALQSVHMFTWSLYGLYSYGKPDTFLLPYYKNDIEKGVLTPEEAQELIDSFILQSIPNMSAWAAEGMMLGGRDKDGNKVENELTWHFLNSIDHTRLPDPNIGFCVTEETSPEILNYVVKLLKSGATQPSIWNCDEVTRSLLKNGFDSEAANMFTLSTCVEVTPIGCSGVSITSPYINILKVFLNSLEKCDDSTDFETIFSTFTKDFDAFVRECILQENLWQIERGRNSTDPMRTSLLIHDCLEKGISHDSGGAKYNVMEPTILGMQNTSESLNCIYRLVFLEKKLTLSQYKEALKNNYEGEYEQLRSYIINKVEHFGTRDEISDNIQKRVADMVMDTFADKTTARGAAIIPGAFSYREHEVQGRVTPASPDGRKNGMPLNDGSCPVQGYDNKGPTISLASTTSWEPSRFLGGISVNVQLGADVAEEKIISLIKGYIKSRGVQMQFNIVDRDTLLDAQKNPQNYRNLLVRIGGYSDFFVRLPKSLQDEVISRTHNNI